MSYKEENKKSEKKIREREREREIRIRKRDGIKKMEVTVPTPSAIQAGSTPKNENYI